MGDAARRALAVVVLLGLLVGMVVHYGAAADRHVTTRQSAAKLGAAEEHAGETVYFWTGVEAVEDDRVVVSRSPSLVVTGVDADVEPGDAIQVYGVIQPDGTVAAERVIVSKRGNLLQLYAVSTLALLLAVGCFLRSWALDRARLVFVPREGDVDA